MNGRLAFGVTIFTIGVLALALSVQPVKSEPYTDEQAAESIGELFLGLVTLALIAIVILGVWVALVVSLAKRRRKTPNLSLSAKISGSP